MLNKKGKPKFDPLKIAEKIQLNKEKKRLKEIDDQNEEQFHLAMKLSEWEIENEIKVESILRKPVKADSVSFVAVRYLHKMTPEEKNEYIRIINKEKYEYEQFTKEKNNLPSKEIQEQDSTGKGDTKKSGGQSNTQ